MIWFDILSPGRSGSTVLSGCLASHPLIRSSDEGGIVSKWYRGELEKGPLNAVISSGIGPGRRGLGFDRERIVHSDRPLVIGDKSDWISVNEYRKRGAPVTLLTDFAVAHGYDLKLIVSVRDPFANIATKIISPKYERTYPDERQRWKQLTRAYRRIYRSIEEMVAGTDYRVISNEKFIAAPRETLISLADWFGLPADADWLKYCESKVFKVPRTPVEIEWPPDRREAMVQFINECSLFEGYR
jgi:hypothetical protein